MKETTNDDACIVLIPQTEEFMEKAICSTSQFKDPVSF